MKVPNFIAPNTDYKLVLYQSPIKYNLVFLIKKLEIYSIQCHLVKTLLNLMLYFSFRGTSNNSSMAAFRETYSELHEFRSLAPTVRMIALTATATSSTRKTIMDVLRMNSPHTVYDNPSKPNVAYSVYYIPKDKPLDDYFQWLGDELMTQRRNSTRTIIYCQTIKQCGLIYSTLKAMLGSKIYLDETHNQNVTFLYTRGKQGSNIAGFSG